MPISPSPSTPNEADPAQHAQPPRRPAQRPAPSADDARVFLNAFGSQIATLSELQTGLTADGRAAGGNRPTSEQSKAFTDPLGLAVREELTTAAGQTTAPPPAESNPAPTPSSPGHRPTHADTTPNSQHAAVADATGTTRDQASTPTSQATSRDDPAKQPAHQPTNQSQATTATPAGSATTSSAQAAAGRAAQAAAAAASPAQVEAAGAARPAQSNAPAVGLERLEALARDRTPSAPPRAERPVLGHQQAEDAPLAAQVSRGFASVLRRGGGTTLIRLQPEALGAVRVHLNLSDAHVQARVEATTAQARDLLMQDISALRAALEQRGLRVEQLDVVLSQSPAEQAKAGDKLQGPAERSPTQQPEEPASGKADTATADDRQEHKASTDPGRTPSRVDTQGRGSADTAPEDPEPATTEHQADRTGIVRDANGNTRLDAVA